MENPVQKFSANTDSYYEFIRLMTARFRLGEMDDISPWDQTLTDAIVEGSEHRALSRKIAHESLVLLQNKDDILPLKPGNRIALIGPNADDAFQYQELYEAIGTLPLKEKSAILLFYVSGYSVKEIAKITGSSQLAVKQQLSRGRSKLREILER